MSKTLTLAVSVIAGLMLAACGGSNAPDPVAAEPTEVPASATVSATALVGYAAALPASETLEPLSIEKAMPPTSETDEPLPV